MSRNGGYSTKIRKERIEPGVPWMNYAETLLYVMRTSTVGRIPHNIHYVDSDRSVAQGGFHIISIQRRLADHAFSNARTRPEIQQAHQTWWKNYNIEHHFGHRKHQDGRYSPLWLLALRRPDPIARKKPGKVVILAEQLMLPEFGATG